MAQRELTDEQDRLDVLEYRNATREEPQPFLCPRHKEQIRLVAEGTETPVLLTGCYDEGFDAFLSHRRTGAAYIRALRTNPEYE